MRWLRARFADAANRPEQYSGSAAGMRHTVTTPEPTEKPQKECIGQPRSRNRRTKPLRQGRASAEEDEASPYRNSPTSRQTPATASRAALAISPLSLAIVVNRKPIRIMRAA
jgi:hypothetical protein